jgi:PAS domain S-box-containing protein
MEPLSDTNGADRQVAQLLRCLVEQATEHSFLLVTAEGQIRWCNRGAERLFAADRSEIVGRPIHEIFTSRDRAAGIDALEMQIASAEAISEDDRWHVRKDGTKFWSSGALLPLKDAHSGELLGFGKIIRDRTDQKTQVDLLSNQLESARQTDVEKDRAITKLSHELRNAIAGLSGAVELLQTPLDNEERRLRFSQLMQKQLSVIERLTQDLLDVKRAGSGKVTLQMEPLVLQTELRELVASVERRVQAARITAQLFAPPADIVIDGDRVRLRQVFSNLLDNAIKYTPAGGRIWVKVTVEDDKAVVHVEDTGRGVPNDMLEKIFDLFTQIDSETSAGGLGVGLALVRELVLLHDGSVQATSKGLGLGSEFTVRLPLTALHAPA